MTKISLRQEILNIKRRNTRVESDKAWENSLTRRLIIFFLTYLVILTVFLSAGIAKPFINALVPSLAFLLSTITVSYAKKVWLKYSKN